MLSNVSSTSSKWWSYKWVSTQLALNYTCKIGPDTLERAFSWCRNGVTKVIVYNSFAKIAKSVTNGLVPPNKMIFLNWRSFNLEEESLQSGHAPLASGIADVEISPQDVKLETVSSTISASTSTSSEDRVTEKLCRHDGTSSEDTQSTSHNRFYDVKVFLFLMCIFCITQGKMLYHSHSFWHFFSATATRP